MRNQKIPFLFVITWILLFASGHDSCFAQKDGDDINIGTYRMIHSQILDEDRLLFVHLPDGYEKTQLSYPVLYLLYVQLYNYFADAAIITEKLGGTGEIPPLIIIGVANTNRYRDLLPVPTRDRGEGGGAENFLRFLEEELIPHIDRTYRTKLYRILAGPQAAAVFSLYALIERPYLFHAIVSENPFMNPENAEFLYPRAEAFFKNTASLKQFLYIKCEKNESSGDLEYLQKLAGLLESQKPAGFQLEIEYRESSGYFILPLPFERALRALFAGHRLPEDFQADNLKDILYYYEKRSGEYGFEVDPPEHMLTFEGVKLNRRGKAKEAIEVFEYQRSLYPKSLNALLQLGETYRGMGDFEKARGYYRAFLDIQDRDAAMIHRRLEQMERIINSSAAYRIEQEIKGNGIKSGLKKYRSIRSDPNNTFYFDEGEFNAMGCRLMGGGKIGEAVEIFRLNEELYPESANVYDSLGEAYMKGRDTKNAIKYYKKSLDLNPQNSNAIEMLKVLEKK